MEIEESGMDEDGSIPGHARCFAETFGTDMAIRTAEVSCWQNMEGGRCVERKTKIWW
jgi:hypothetical protein